MRRVTEARGVVFEGNSNRCGADCLRHVAGISRKIYIPPDHLGKVS